MVRQLLAPIEPGFGTVFPLSAADSVFKYLPKIHHFSSVLVMFFNRFFFIIDPFLFFLLKIFSPESISD